MVYSAGGDPRVTTTTNTTGTITAAVDLLGRTTSYTDTAGVVTATSFDLAGRVTTVTTTVAGVASTVGYSWRDDGQMTAITLDGVAVATLGYDPAGELAGVTYPIGGLGGLTKQPSGALVGDTWTVNLANGASRTFTESLTRSQAGRVTASSWTDTGSPGSAVGWGYSYDQAGRLTQAVLAPAAGRPQASFGYSFNPTGGCGVDPQAGMNGSRTGSSVQIGSGAPALTSYCYDQASRLTSTTGANPIDPATVRYDLHGNATRIGDQTWTYDGADQVTGTTVVSTGQQLVYTRDSSGRVVQRQATGPETATARYGFAGGDDSPDLLLNAAGQPVERFLSLPGGVLLTKPATGATTRWAIPNLHGDTSILIGITTGAVTVTGAGWINDPYGQPINPNTGQIDLAATPTTRTGTGTTDAWLGQHQRGYEHTTGLNQMLMGARTYLPTLGIFTATDPIEAGNDTTYGYPNDPINKTDLSGNAWWDAVGAALGVVSVVACVVGGPIACLAAAGASAAWSIGSRIANNYVAGREWSIEDTKESLLDVVGVAISPLRAVKAARALGGGQRAIRPTIVSSIRGFFHSPSRVKKVEGPWYSIKAYRAVAKRHPIRTLARLAFSTRSAASAYSSFVSWRAS